MRSRDSYQHFFKVLMYVASHCKCQVHIIFLLAGLDNVRITSKSWSS